MAVIKVLKTEGLTMKVHDIDPNYYVRQIFDTINNFHKRWGETPEYIIIGPGQHKGIIESPLYIGKKLMHGNHNCFNAKIIVSPDFNGILAIHDPKDKHWHWLED